MMCTESKFDFLLKFIQLYITIATAHAKYDKDKLPELHFVSRNQELRDCLYSYKMNAPESYPIKDLRSFFNKETKPKLIQVLRLIRRMFCLRFNQV